MKKTEFHPSIYVHEALIVSKIRYLPGVGVKSVIRIAVINYIIFREAYIEISKRDPQVKL